MQEFKELVPKIGERGFLVGKTGSGKTTLAECICNVFPYVVVYDTKGTIKWKDYTVFRNLSDCVKAKESKIIYRPDAEELLNQDFHEAFFKWIYNRKNTCLYVDEVYSICNSKNIPFHFLGVLTRGREFNITVLNSSQRPGNIPLVIKSEAEKFYVFRLNLKVDSEAVELITGIESDDIQNLSKYHFLYCDIDGDDIIGPLKLEI